LADEDNTHLKKAYQAYRDRLQERRTIWTVADNPVENRDAIKDASEQQQRLDAVFYTIKTGEKPSDYDEMISAMPDDPVRRMQYKFEKYII